jgi:hypothetical protein
MDLTLSTEEARFLKTHLDRHIEHVQNELIHTDKVQLQHGLADDLRRLQAIEQRLEQILK